MRDFVAFLMDGAATGVLCTIGALAATAAAGALAFVIQDIVGTQKRLNKREEELKRMRRYYGRQ